MCVCGGGGGVFIGLHITAQSAPVILLESFYDTHRYWSSQGRINDTYYEKLFSGAAKGTHSFYRSYSRPERLPSIIFSRFSGLTSTKPIL